MIRVQKEQLMVFFVISYKIILKDGWLERTRTRNQTTYLAPQTFSQPY